MQVVFLVMQLMSIKKENDGALPDSALMNKKASLASVGAASLEMFGDTRLLNTIKGGKESAKEIAQEFGLKGSAKEVVKSIGSEGATEAAQQALEGIAVKDKVDGEEVYKAGAIGGASGGVITGVGKTKNIVTGTGKAVKSVATGTAKVVGKGATARKKS